jgi:hypothetical protein
MGTPPYNLRMNHPKNAAVYCIADFHLKYTPFSKSREENVNRKSLPKTQPVPFHTA